MCSAESGSASSGLGEARRMMSAISALVGLRGLELIRSAMACETFSKSASSTRPAAIMRSAG